MSLPADFAVIIPHYNDVARLTRCLSALETQDRTNVEVIVADNASSVDMADVMGQFNWVKFVTETSKGAAAARNCGVRETAARWFFFLDADCVPTPDWLFVARSIAADYPDQITGGIVTVFDETPAPKSGAEAFETVFAFDQESYIAQKGFSVTANLLVSRAVFEAVGDFTPGVSEDFDWCQRAVAAGFKLNYQQELSVSHPTRSNWYELSRKWRRLTDETFGLQQDAGLSGKLKWAFKALLMPISAIAHIPRVLLHPDLSALERGRALLTLIRLRLTRMVWMLHQLGQRPS